MNQAQVQVWAENFRMRFVTLKERMDFLKSDGFDKVKRLSSSLEPKMFSVPRMAGVT